MRPRVTGAILALSLVWGCGASQPPPQPIPFSHRTHAGKNEMGCEMCHSYVRRSPYAGMPALSVCNGCHRFVATDKPAVQRLNAAFQDGESIAWTRVYWLPEHVRFPHDRHVAASLRCEACHGDVRAMDVLRRAAPLTMGWCLDCHEQRHAPRDCLTCHY